MEKKAYGASQEFTYLPEFGIDSPAGVTAVTVKLSLQVVTILASQSL